MFVVANSGDVQSCVDDEDGFVQRTPHGVFTTCRTVSSGRAVLMLQFHLNILESAVYTGHRKRPGPLTVLNARTPSIPLQKLLFSATLSHDPEQLEQLNLFEPSLYRCVVPAQGDTAQSLPASLTQLYTVCRQEEKPLASSWCFSRSCHSSAVFSSQRDHNCCAHKGQRFSA